MNRLIRPEFTLPELSTGAAIRDGFSSDHLAIAPVTTCCRKSQSYASQPFPPFLRAGYHYLGICNQIPGLFVVHLCRHEGQKAEYPGQ